MSLKPLAVTLFLGGSLLIVSYYGQGEEPAPPARRAESTTQPDLSRVEKQIFDAANELRRQMKHGELKVNSDLAKAARYFAQFMAENDKYGHDADGSQPWERAKKYGYDYCLVEENIAYQFRPGGLTAQQLAEKFFQGWKDSPPHRQNMLNPDVDETAVAVAHSGKTGKYFAVQLFGRPKSAAIKFSVSNRTDAELKYTVDDQTFTVKPRFTQTHEVCTSPKLSFVGLDDAEVKSREAKVYLPRSGGQFVVRQDGSGKLVIENQ